MKTIFIFLIFCFSMPLFGQTLHNLTANNIPQTDTIKVFLPKNYSATKAYPIVLMLHGWSGNHEQWSNITNLQKFADQYNWIIACPNGFFYSWYLDSPEMPDSQYESYFFETLMPFLKEKYRLDEKNIFITGLSMGGQGALRLFLKNLDFFNTAGSTSGLFDLKVAGNKYGLDKVLGKKEDFAERWAANSVMGLLEPIQGTEKTFIFDCGKKDPFFKNNVEMDELCKKMGIKAVFSPQEGDQNKTYWANSIKAHFEFFKKNLK